MMTSVHEALLHRVADGPVRITELTTSVARQTRTDVEKVTATVWELVSEGVLGYRADAHVTTGEAQEG